MPTPKWIGVYPAVTTPFNSNEEIDFPLFSQQLEFQLTSGVHGIILCGSLGEASTLETYEKFHLLESALTIVDGRVPVILTIAEQATRQATSFARKAKEMGADGLMVLPPLRYSADAAEVLDWYNSITDASGLPVMIYNNPVDYKTLITLDMFEQLAKNPLIQSVKESTRDISNITRMKNIFGDRFKLLCGVDTLAMEELVMGADGWVAGLVCAFPKETVTIYNHIQQGNLEKARDIYRWFLPLLELDIHPKLVQYIKLAEALAGNGTEFTRAPRKVLSGTEKTTIEAIINKGLETRPTL